MESFLQPTLNTWDLDGPVAADAALMQMIGSLSMVSDFQIQCIPERTNSWACHLLEISLIIGSVCKDFLYRSESFRERQSDCCPFSLE